jgi:uncharacterized protein (TIGR02996 family)
MHDAFLQAIIENPEDDTHRLVYADWLEENGDELGMAHARLIRVQCDLANLPADDPRRAELEEQEACLLDTHGKTWTKPLRKLGFGSKVARRFRFRQGFLAEGKMSATDFVNRAEKLFKAVPTLHVMRFPDASNEVKSLSECPYLARLTEVDLNAMCSCGSCPIQRELRILFASPNVARLTVLNLAGNRLDPETARALAASPHLGRLRALDLSGNSLRTAGARALATSPNLANLTTLNLAGADIGPAGGRDLADSPHLKRLTTLDLSDNPIGPRMIAKLRARFGAALRI